jgi:hypothetical protein
VAVDQDARSTLGALQAFRPVSVREVVQHASSVSEVLHDDKLLSAGACDQPFCFTEDRLLPAAGQQPVCLWASR